MTGPGHSATPLPRIVVPAWRRAEPALPRPGRLCRVSLGASLVGRMADVINLRRARKTKAREAAATKAAINRAQFGKSKTERASERREAEQRERALDQHQRVPEPEPGDEGP